MASEDFSFPIISSNTYPSFTLYPSLWPLSSVIYPDYSFEEEEDDELHTKLESFPLCSESEARKDWNIDPKEQEKMDLLWENFNEELQRVSSCAKNNPFCEFSGECCELRKKLGICKRHGDLKMYKRRRVFVVVQALKKILLPYKSVKIRSKSFRIS